MGCFREKILTIPSPWRIFVLVSAERSWPSSPNHFVPVDLAAHELTCHARRCLPELRPGMSSILYIAIIAAVVVSRRRKGALVSILPDVRERCPVWFNAGKEIHFQQHGTA
jgi:hypothetical protein